MYNLLSALARLLWQILCTPHILCMGFQLEICLERKENHYSLTEYVWNPWSLKLQVVWCSIHTVRSKSRALNFKTFASCSYTYINIHTKKPVPCNVFILQTQSSKNKDTRIVDLFTQSSTLSKGFILLN